MGRGEAREGGEEGREGKGREVMTKGGRGEREREARREGNVRMRVVRRKEWETFKGG